MILFSFSELSEYVDAVKGFFSSVYDFIVFGFNLLPSPFNTIALSFVTIIIAIVIVKTIRG